MYRQEVRMNRNDFPAFSQRVSRTRQMVGEEGIQKLLSARVAVFGIGGVGSYCIEALARSGIGSLMIVDCDVVEESNFNRQLIATVENLGKEKTLAMKNRIAAFNPDCNVEALFRRLEGETVNSFDFSRLDYIVDAIDTVSSKLLLVEKAKAAGVPIICCMGTGNKIMPERLKIADISKTAVCPLARVMRRELKKRKIDNLTVVYSDELPVQTGVRGRDENTRRSSPASMPFVPAAAGCLLASAVVRDLLG
ncbi:MAG TPA: tRNA threonylcarbamoyladenosine dehydratase [Clostridiales bacterium]|nr:tRNA threonylcarbamoyladenosine dehydratase [Clostridiales bacterium]